MRKRVFQERIQEIDNDIQVLMLELATENIPLKKWVIEEAIRFLENTRTLNEMLFKDDRPERRIQ